MTHATGADASQLIIEGSGVLPERFADLTIPGTAAVWLTACADVLRDRIYSASRFRERTAQEKIMVDKFLGRTDRYNELILGAVKSLGLASMDTSAALSASETVKRCLRLIG
jgi:hypothetical protein